jgi:indolepyruvate ferredoxin oxidoreductase
MVVEEKRSLIEVQVREELYGTANQPLCIGKKDEGGNWLFPVKGSLDPNDIAIAIGERLLRYHNNDDLRGRVERLREAQRVLALTSDVATRTPHFCSGCPHNTSTKVPEGMRAYAGIGCHYMVSGWTGPPTASPRWAARARTGSARTPSPSAATSSRTSATAPTTTRVAGAALGDPHQDERHLQDPLQRRRRHDGRPEPRGRAHRRHDRRQVRAEGVERIALVSDEPNKYPSTTQWPRGSPSTTATTSTRCSANCPSCPASRS